MCSLSLPSHPPAWATATAIGAEASQRTKARYPSHVQCIGYVQMSKGQPVQMTCHESASVQVKSSVWNIRSRTGRNCLQEGGSQACSQRGRWWWGCRGWLDEPMVLADFGTQKRKEHAHWFKSQPPCPTSLCSLDVQKSRLRGWRRFWGKTILLLDHCYTVLTV